MFKYVVFFRFKYEESSSFTVMSWTIRPHLLLLLSLLPLLQFFPWRWHIAWWHAGAAGIYSSWNHFFKTGRKKSKTNSLIFFKETHVSLLFLWRGTSPCPNDKKPSWKNLKHQLQLTHLRSHWPIPIHPPSIAKNSNLLAYCNHLRFQVWESEIFGAKFRTKLIFQHK